MSSTVTISSEEYHELLTFFSNDSVASNNVLSLALTLNESASISPTSNIVDFTTAVDIYLATSTAMPSLNASHRNHSNNMVATRIGVDLPIWLILCYGFIFLFSIGGNVLVISTLAHNRRMRTITNIFLFNLAISDILLGMFCMPMTLIGTLLRKFVFNVYICKAIQFSQATSVAVSSWTLVFISLERYYAICHPLSSRTWQTASHARKMIALIWFFSCFCMVPIICYSKLIPTRHGSYKCREHWPEDNFLNERSYNIFLDIMLLIVPLSILCVAYIQITRTLYVGMRNERALIFGGTTNNKLCNDVDALPTVTAMPASGFNFNVSFRTQGRPSCGTGGDGSRKQYKRPQPQQQLCYDDISGHKRKLLTATDGRRHLYCMRTASMKSLHQNNNERVNGVGAAGGCGGTSPSPSMTVINVPQQQRFKLQQQRQQQYQPHMQQSDTLRRKSTSTPSLRITDGVLRRSNKTKSLESKRRVIKMLFVLVLEFFICWTPLYVINTVAMFIGPAIYEYVDYSAISLFQLLAYSSSCCNPITYCFMNAGFRRAFLDSFKGLQLCGGYFGRKNSTNHSVAGNSIIMANSATMMTTHSILDSPRL